MSAPSVKPDIQGTSALGNRYLPYALAAFAVAISPISFRQSLIHRLFASNYLPHYYCYLGRAGLVWTHVVSDSLIGLAYFAISATLAYLVFKERGNIPFHWIFVAFGLFIVACGGTHLMEVVTVWKPVYVLSGGVKVFTALASVVTAALLPFAVPRVRVLVDDAKTSEQHKQWLIENERKIRAITETALDGIISADSQGRSVYFNPAAERMFGYSPSEVLGRPYLVLIADRFRAAHGTELQRFLATREAHLAGRTVDLVGRRRDGSEVPLILALSAWESNGETFLTGILRDTTDRERAERRFRVLLEGAPDAMVVVDQSGRIVLVNAQTETVFGYRREELLGQPVESLIPARFRGHHRLYREQFSGEPRVRPMGEGLQLYGLHKDGHEFPVEVSLSPLETDEGLLVSSAIRDITERRVAENRIQELNRETARQNAELITINRELESFSYSVSHDLRAPLRAIEGFSLALLEDCDHKLEPHEKEHLRRVRSATTHMSRLIDGMLNLARTSRHQLVRGKVDLSGVAREIACQLQVAEPERRVTFIIAEQLMVQGDSVLLRVMLENLLRNAWKFTSRKKEARIELGVRRDGSATVYFISDDGVGFDMKYVDKLFGPFQRLHDSTEFPGTGVGLATVQRIVSRHGGRIWAEGAVGKGATFCFVLGTETRVHGSTEVCDRQERRPQPPEAGGARS